MKRTGSTIKKMNIFLTNIILILIIVVCTSWVKSEEFADSASENSNANSLKVRDIHRLAINEAKEGNCETAIVNMLIAAESGFDLALLDYGNWLEHGKCVDKNHDLAFEYIAKSAKSERPIALAKLGWMYQNGIGVDQSYIVAAKYYEKAAKAGNAMAMNNLGYFYQHGLGVHTDKEKAMNLYSEAVSLGNKPAVKNLASLSTP